jgi:hypothetical protein
MWAYPCHQPLDARRKGVETGLSDSIATEDWTWIVESVVLWRKIGCRVVISHIHILRSPWYKERTGGRRPTKLSSLDLRESDLLTKLRRKWPLELTEIELV